MTFSNIAYSLIYREINNITILDNDTLIINKTMIFYNNENKIVKNVFVFFNWSEKNILYSSVSFNLTKNGLLFRNISIAPNTTKVIYIVYTINSTPIYRSGDDAFLLIYECPGRNTIYNFILPKGAIVKKSGNLLFLSPNPEKITTDGEHIIIRYNISGCTPLIIGYTLPKPFNPNYFIFLFCIIFLIIIALILTYKYLKRRLIFSILKKEERELVEEILKRGNELKQKDLYELDEFSRAKVSRILKELEERNIVERKVVRKEKIIRVRI